MFVGALKTIFKAIFQYFIALIAMWLFFLSLIFAFSYGNTVGWSYLGFILIAVFYFGKE